MLQFNSNQEILSLYDKDFLLNLIKQTNKEIFARVTSLNFNEEPIEQIEGKITGGSINIDGGSSVQRTCNLTFINDSINLNDFYYSIKTKIFLEIGLRNNLTGQYKENDKEYPEIVWFPEGIFIISNFNSSSSEGGSTISLSGKDKMCLLNGEFGGQLFASIDLGTEEEVKYSLQLTNLNINDIISEIGLNKYYIEIASLPSSQQPLTIIANEAIEEQDNLLYSFSELTKEEIVALKKNNSSCCYYKNGNLYHKITSSQIRDYHKIYKAYKLIEVPEDELYIPIKLAEEDYKKNTYYYNINEGKEDSAIYQIDSSEKKKNRTYYSLNPVYIKNTEIQKKQLTLEKIIRESVHAYGKEPYHNIIINDLDDYGLEQLTYKGDSLLYALYDIAESQFTNLILEDQNSSLKEVITKTKNFQFQSLNEAAVNLGTKIYFNSATKSFTTNPTEDNITKVYTVAKISYGMDLGYRLTDLVYTGDLISQIGDSLTSMLDKIKAMLGDFEYFYDIQGRFIFQRKKTYVYTSWSQLTNNQDETYVDFANDINKLSFNFENNLLISALQNSPNLSNLRNDFVVWGSRKSISGKDIPIHGRYAIDKKPVFYRSFDGNIYTSNIKYPIEEKVISKEEYDNIIDQYIDLNNDKIKALYNFQLEHLFPYKLSSETEENNSMIPKQQEDGSWSSGWWHITDWARYYQLLYNTLATPSGPLKLYTTNDEKGFLPIKKILNLQDSQQKDCFDTGQKQYYNTHNKSIWLIEIDKTGKMWFTHSGRLNNIFDRTRPSICTYYEEDSFGHKIIKKKKILYPPFASCGDSHDYSFLLNRMKETEREIYIYNPCFSTNPNVSIQDLIHKQTIINSDSIMNGYKKLLYQHRIHIVDWREIIYQMALDHIAGQGCSEKDPLYIRSLTEQEIINGYKQYEDSEKTLPVMALEKLSNPDHFLYEVGKRNPHYYPTGYTGYEQYYTDLLGFWRELYNPNYIPPAIYSSGEYRMIQDNDKVRKIWQPPQIKDYQVEYYVDANEEITNFQLNVLKENGQTENLNKYNAKIVEANYQDASSRLYWNINVFEQPELLNFWIDFLDSDLELAQFSIPIVGDRIKVVKEDKVKSLIYSTIPNFILYDETESTENNTCDFNKLRREIIDKSGYTFIRVPRGFSQYFSISYRNESVKNKIDSLLYQYGYRVENITITSIPIYFLTPNTRIFVRDDVTKINGEYIVEKITLPLTYNGTMSISATKAPTRLY